MVEHRLAKARVAGSSPVSRSNLRSLRCHPWHGLAELEPCTAGRIPAAVFMMGRGTQVVRERSAKPLCVGSIPTRASIFFNNLADRPNGPVAKMVVN